MLPVVACFRGEFFLTFSPVPLRFEVRFRDGSIGLSLYFHLVYSSEIVVVASGTKSTRKLFRQATERMVLIDHEFVRNSTFPLFAPLPCRFHMGILLFMEKRVPG